MNAKRLLASTVFALAASTAVATEPTSLAQVKTIILRFDDSASVTGLILTELESRLPKLGFAVTEDESLADAELVMIGLESTNWHLSAYGGGSRHEVDARIRVRALPSTRLLFSATVGVADDELDDACAAAAKKVAKKLDDEREA